MVFAASLALIKKQKTCLAIYVDSPNVPRLDSTFKIKALTTQIHQNNDTNAVMKPIKPHS